MPQQIRQQAVKKHHKEKMEEQLKLEVKNLEGCNYNSLIAKMTLRKKLKNLVAVNEKLNMFI